MAASIYRESRVSRKSLCATALASRADFNLRSTWKSAQVAIKAALLSRTPSSRTAGHRPPSLAMMAFSGQPRLSTPNRRRSGRKTKRTMNAPNPTATSRRTIAGIIRISPSRPHTDFPFRPVYSFDGTCPHCRGMFCSDPATHAPRSSLRVVPRTSPAVQARPRAHARNSILPAGEQRLRATFRELTVNGSEPPRITARAWFNARGRHDPCKRHLRSPPGASLSIQAGARRRARAHFLIHTVPGTLWACPFAGSTRRVHDEPPGSRVETRSTRNAPGPP